MSHLFQGSLHASAYSKFRLSPPVGLIKAIISFVKSKNTISFGTAVDIGCGTGQSTIALSPYFTKVIGLDASAAQIQNAKESRSAPNVTYRVISAEETHIDACSVDLVTVAQALHWFDLDKFYNEVRRILVPSGVFAAYGHWIPIPTTDNEQQSLKLKHLIGHHLHDDVLGKYWDPKRYDILKKHYKTIEFPFNDYIRETFVVNTSSTVADYVGYISSWSALHTLRKEDPNKAENILLDTQESLLKILEVETTAQDTPLSLVTDYFMVMGTKPS